MIYGVGVDIIEVKRVGEKILKTAGFRETVFTSKEILYCEAKKHKTQNYAARFAAKEAFLKATGIGWRQGLAFNEVEVVNTSLGKPKIVLHGKAKEWQKKTGITRIQVSLSHIMDFATSIVIVEK